MAIRKNRREKGRREELLGSNPHSNGEAFSRSTIVFLESTDARIITTDEIIKMIDIINNIERIIYTKII